MTGKVGKADRWVDPAVLVEDRGAEGAEAEAAAALPSDILRYAALFALNDLLQAQGAMSAGNPTKLSRPGRPISRIQTRVGKIFRFFLRQSCDRPKSTPKTQDRSFETPSPSRSIPGFLTVVTANAVFSGRGHWARTPPDPMLEVYS
ncbi:hypothetical protein [Roseovarius sp.]|uniref:hypothetical protein n=1 Tax=Roseovarius sp. TaxID=1486281 RepID=UPI00261E4DA5|nr:hypothetical protein [Roseovarius sp.]